MQQRLDKSDTVVFAKQRASMLDMKVKIVTNGSLNVPNDLCEIANTKVSKIYALSISSIIYD